MKINFKSKNEWLKLKEPYIGASTIHNLFPPDFISFKNFFNNFKNKVPTVINERMEWGLILEDIIAKEFSKRMQLKLIKPKWFYVEDTQKQICATPDRITTNEDLIVEVKNSQYFKNEIMGIPFKYYCQLQAQMLCSGIKKAYLVVLISGSQLNHFAFDYDKEFGEQLITFAKQFFKALELNQPEHYFNYYTYNFKKGEEKEENSINIDENLIDRLIQLTNLKNEIDKELDDIKSVLKAQDIKQETNFYNKLIINPVIRETIDYKRLIEDHGLSSVVNNYKKQTTFLTIKIIGGNNE